MSSVVTSIGATFVRLQLVVTTSVGAGVVTAGIEFSLTSRASARFLELRRSVRQSHTAMLDQETAIRGYLLTRSPSFLTPFEEGRRALQACDLTLLTSLSPDSDLAAVALEMFRAQNAWVSEWAVPAVRDGAVSPDFLATGKRLFDRYRTSQARLEMAVDIKFADVETVRRRWLAFGMAAQLAACGYGFFFVLRRKASLESDLVRPMAELRAALHQVKVGNIEGDLIPVNGAEEFLQIGAGLNDLRIALIESQGRTRKRETELAAHLQRLKVILDAAREFSGSQSLRYIVRAVGSSALRITEYGASRVWVVDTEEKTLLPVFDSEGPKQEPLGIDALAIGDGLAGRAAKYGRTVTQEGGLAVPAICGARVVGVIELTCCSGLVADANAQEVVELLASHAGTAIESARLHQIATERSERDALTGLWNRRKLDDDLAVEWARSARYERPLSFIMLDVDHFKAFNDLHGHAKADVVLQDLAKLLDKGVRSLDSVYRYGGEEFAILLRETPAEGAAEIAERLRKQVELRFVEGDHRVTASFGVAGLSKNMQSPAALIEAADRMLYDAKRERNCVATRTEG